MSGEFMVLMPWAKLLSVRVQSMTNTMRKNGARIQGARRLSFLLEVILFLCRVTSYGSF